MSKLPKFRHTDEVLITSDFYKIEDRLGNVRRWDGKSKYEVSFTKRDENDRSIVIIEWFKASELKEIK